MTDDPVIVIDAMNIGSDSLDVNEDILNKVGQNLVASFRDLGFVYLKNHGLPEDVQQQALTAARAFFQRSSSYKREYQRFGRLGFNGYTALGVERTGLANQETAPTDFKECFDIKASKQHQTLPGELCDAIPPLSSHCCRLVERLLSALDRALDFRGVLVSAHDGMCFDQSYTTLRLLQYPVIDQEQCSESLPVTRCAAHTDYGTMTVLFQDNRPGLQVMSRTGHWTDIVPRPGHLLINIGDLVEIWTGGQLKATLHRVTSAGRQGREHPRLSMAFFVHPNKSVVVRPVLGDQCSDKYAAVKPSDFLQRKFAATYSNYTIYGAHVKSGATSDTSSLGNGQVKSTVVAGGEVRNRNSRWTRRGDFHRNQGAFAQVALGSVSRGSARSSQGARTESTVRNNAVHLKSHNRVVGVSGFGGHVVTSNGGGADGFSSFRGPGRNRNLQGKLGSNIQGSTENFGNFGSIQSSSTNIH